MKFAELKALAKSLGIRKPDGDSRRKQTWIDAIAAASNGQSTHDSRSTQRRSTASARSQQSQLERKGQHSNEKTKSLAERCAHAEGQVEKLQSEIAELRQSFGCLEVKDRDCGDYEIIRHLKLFCTSTPRPHVDFMCLCLHVH